jgi:hypothetical protein
MYRMDHISNDNIIIFFQSLPFVRLNNSSGTVDKFSDDILNLRRSPQFKTPRRLSSWRVAKRFPIMNQEFHCHQKFISS